MVKTARRIRTGSRTRRQVGRPARDAAAGFTYLALLFWIAIAGIGLAALGPMWSQDARRQRETELFFRGAAYQRALQSYVNSNGQLPERLQDLLDDTSKGGHVRHLRRLYADPFTGQPWGLVRHEGRIRGVFSESELVPLRRLDGVESYRDIRFEVDPPQPAGQQAPGAASAAASAAASGAAGTSPFDNGLPWLRGGRDR